HPGAALCRVALPGRSAALGAGGDEAVGGAGGARAGTQLLGIANTGRSAADRSGVAGRVLAGVVDSVALIQGARVGVGGAGGPERRLLHGPLPICHPGAALCRVALPGRSAALGAGGDEAVGGAGGARAATRLLDIADSGRGAADRSG